MKKPRVWLILSKQNRKDEWKLTLVDTKLDKPVPAVFFSQSHCLDELKRARELYTAEGFVFDCRWLTVERALPYIQELLESGLEY
jgi:hypothetical protein